eukprot:gnl/TRDRNA2_/TRDRNA2_74373_c1_seq2.p1 gnl/TRDRNA2_/TRDRNA2_74373_c1~~gnl/TRDRNA2_/TRDRNA2_74373_c1_seq2.p1  ORF type:complete len:196 (+),score=9.90 gnl/TRDRNA2_/TRDRNA2_74373_c1_seq2:107-694(+)
MSREAHSMTSRHQQQLLKTGRLKQSRQLRPGQVPGGRSRTGAICKETRSERKHQMPPYERQHVSSRTWSRMQEKNTPVQIWEKVAFIEKKSEKEFYRIERVLRQGHIESCKVWEDNLQFYIIPNSMNKRCLKKQTSLQSSQTPQLGWMELGDTEWYTQVDKFVWPTSRPRFDYDSWNVHLAFRESGSTASCGVQE